MTGDGIVVKGAGDLAEIFDSLADDIKGDVLEAATRAAALPVLNQVRTTEPEGGKTPYKSGTYRRSFHMETVEKTETRCTVEIGTDSPYGARLEYGFVGPDSLGRVFNQPARPHVRPAFDENVEASTTEFKAAVDAVVTKGAERHAD